jgi:hypothetical protein
MIFSTLASAILVVGAAAIPHDKRATISDATIYAYGTGMDGLPILSDSNGTFNFRRSHL